MGEIETYGYNLTPIFLDAQERTYNRLEGKIGDYISQLSLLNEQNRDLQKLIAQLAHAKKDKKADFTRDEETKTAIDAIKEFAPTIFGNINLTNGQQYIWKTEEEIETTLTLLDNQVKAQVAEVNKVTMFINQGYEDRIQYTDNAQKTLEMMIRHIESIIAKYRKN